MSGKADYVRAVLADMPDAGASEIASEVAARYGVGVSGAYVRVVRSRDSKEDAADSRPVPAVRHQMEPRQVSRPVPPVIREDDPDDVTQENSELGQKIDRCIEAVVQALSGTPQMVTGSMELISEISAILSDPAFMADYPGFTWQTRQVPSGAWSLTIWQRDTFSSIPVPASVTVQNAYVPPEIPRSRSVRGNRHPAASEKCDFCGRMPGVTTTGLYRVSGGALGRLRILCHLCAAPEAVAGSDVRPYLVQSGDAGIVQAPRIRYQEYLAGLMKSAKDFLLDPERDPVLAGQANSPAHPDLIGAGEFTA